MSSSYVTISKKTPLVDFPRAFSSSTVAIIGTAGRSTDEKHLSIDLYDKMYAAIKYIIQHVFKLDKDNFHLYSGGAAWSDHLAVRFYLEHGGKLTLFLPCKFTLDEECPQAVDNGSYDWKLNPGKTMNKLHRAFGDRIRRDSLRDIATASEMGATLDSESKGFHARNSKIAQAMYMIAFSFGDGDEPTEGGTKDTWSKSKSLHKIHVSLKRLMKTSTVEELFI